MENDMAYYSVMLLFTVIVLIITVADVSNNRLVSEKNKTEIIFVCTLIFVASLCEFAGAVLQGNALLPTGIQKIIHTLELCLAPCIGVAAANAYGSPGNLRLAKVLLAVHAAVEIICLFPGWIFRVDEQNRICPQKLYALFVLAFLVSIAYCYVCIIRNNQKYQARLSVVNFLILVFLAFGIGLSFFSRDTLDVYFCITLANFFSYHYRGTVVNQVDVTTRLLNRRCYERSLENIKAPAYVLIFDVNRFKQINDTYGHAEGDKCLSLFAQKIFDVYGKSGFCYRIGGDEFCAILHKDLDKLEQLNQKFAHSVEGLTIDGNKLFGISFGYAYYGKSQTDIDEVIKQADDMMYRNKAKAKELLPG